MKIHTHTHITRARLTSVSQQLSHANVNRFSFYRITSIYKHSETNRSNQVTKLKEKTTHTKHTQPNGINRNIKIEQKLLFFGTLHTISFKTFWSTFGSDLNRKGILHEI